MKGLEMSKETKKHTRRIRSTYLLMMANSIFNLNIIIKCIGCIETIEVKKIQSIPNKPDISCVSVIPKPAKKCFMAFINCRLCERRIKKSPEDLNQGSQGVPCVSQTIFDDTSMRNTALVLGYSNPWLCNPAFVTMDQIMSALKGTSMIAGIKTLESDRVNFNVQKDSLRSSFIM